MLRSIGLIVALLATPAHAGVYKCVIDGNTVFTDHPCKDSQERASGRLDNTPAMRIQSQNGRAIQGDSVLAEEASAEQPGPQIIETCLSVYRPKLRDPRGAYADGGAFYPSKRGAKDVVVHARATNGFGGYVARNLRCTLKADGSIDTDATKLWEAYFTFDLEPVK